MTNKVARVMWAGVAGAALMACSDGGGAVALTRGQLAERLSGGAARVEVELRADGSVREVEIDDDLGHEEQLEGRVVSLDAAGGLLEVEHLGTVGFKGATRYRTEGGTTSSQAWLAGVELALASGRTVWLDARGAFKSDGFEANELRWEDDADRSVEAWVRAEDFDAVSGTLRIGELTFAIGAAPIRNDDDSIDDDLDGSTDDDDDLDGSTDDDDDLDGGTDDDDDLDGSTDDDDDLDGSTDDDDDLGGSTDDDDDLGGSTDDDDDLGGSTDDDDDLDDDSDDDDSDDDDDDDQDDDARNEDDDDR